MKYRPLTPIDLLNQVFYDRNYYIDGNLHEDEVDTGFLADAIESSPLTDREKIALRLRFFEGKTLRETAQHLGVTTERGRQIAAKGVRRLRYLDYIHRLKSTCPGWFNAYRNPKNTSIL